MAGTRFFLFIAAFGHSLFKLRRYRCALPSAELALFIGVGGIVQTASFPCSMALADERDLKPRIGVSRFFKAAWSLSILLFSHFRLMSTNAVPHHLLPA